MQRSIDSYFGADTIKDSHSKNESGVCQKQTNKENKEDLSFDKELKRNKHKIVNPIPQKELWSAHNLPQQNSIKSLSTALTENDGNSNASLINNRKVLFHRIRNIDLQQPLPVIFKDFSRETPKDETRIMSPKFDANENYVNDPITLNLMINEDVRIYGSEISTLLHNVKSTESLDRSSTAKTVFDVPTPHFQMINSSDLFTSHMNEEKEKKTENIDEIEIEIEIGKEKYTEMECEKVSVSQKYSQPSELVHSEPIVHVARTFKQPSGYLINVEESADMDVYSPNIRYEADDSDIVFLNRYNENFSQHITVSELEIVFEALERICYYLSEQTKFSQLNSLSDEAIHENETSGPINCICDKKTKAKRELGECTCPSRTRRKKMALLAEKHWTSEEPILVCEICLEGNSQNEIVRFCDGCKATVHLSCYGKSSKDIKHFQNTCARTGKDVWYCDLCARERAKDIKRQIKLRKGRKCFENIQHVQCVLCGRKGGALKFAVFETDDFNTSKTKYAHVLCSLCVYSNVKIVKLKDTSNTILRFDNLVLSNDQKCFVCEQSNGVLIKCECCDTFAHPFCAREMNLALGFRNGNEASVNVSFFCAFHSIFSAGHFPFSLSYKMQSVLLPPPETKKKNSSDENNDQKKNMNSPNSEDLFDNHRMKSPYLSPIETSNPLTSSSHSCIRLPFSASSPPLLPLALSTTCFPTLNSNEFASNKISILSSITANETNAPSFIPQQRCAHIQSRFCSCSVCRARDLNPFGHISSSERHHTLNHSNIGLNYPYCTFCSDLSAALGSPNTLCELLNSLGVPQERSADNEVVNFDPKFEYETKPKAISREYEQPTVSTLNFSTINFDTNHFRQTDLHNVSVLATYWLMKRVSRNNISLLPQYQDSIVSTSLERDDIFFGFFKCASENMSPFDETSERLKILRRNLVLSQDFVENVRKRERIKRESVVCLLQASEHLSHCLKTDKTEKTDKSENTLKECLSPASFVSSSSAGSLNKQLFTFTHPRANTQTIIMKRNEFEQQQRKIKKEQRKLAKRRKIDQLLSPEIRTSTNTSSSVTIPIDIVQPVKRKRGRPRKYFPAPQN